jgi:DNA (cytosine-5)-methyltransferase 1
VKLHGANTADDHETWEEADTARTLNSVGHAGANGALVTEEPQAFLTRAYTRGKDGALADTAPSLTKEADRGDGHPQVLEQAGVRRLTPTECERLQSFPDGWTIIPMVKGREAKGQTTLEG